MRWKSISFGLGLVAVTLVLATGALAQGGFDLSWWTLAGGGGTSSGGGFAVSGSIGQPDAGLLTGGGYTLNGGFWRPQTPPRLEGAPVYMPLTLRSTAPVVAQDCPGGEPANNTSAGAGIITTFGVDCKSTLPGSDEDWYKFTVQPGKLVTIDLSGLPAAADYDVIIYDSAIRYIDRSTKGAGEPDRVFFTSSGNGIYYARVILVGQNSAPFTYLLRVSVG